MDRVLSYNLLSSHQLRVRVSGREEEAAEKRALLILMRVQSWILVGSLFARCTIAARKMSCRSGASYTLFISCLVQYLRSRVVFAGGVGAMDASWAMAVACERLRGAFRSTGTGTVRNRALIVADYGGRSGVAHSEHTNICPPNEYLSFSPRSQTNRTSLRILRNAGQHGDDGTHPW